jgi:hypothetical protein
MKSISQLAVLRAGSSGVLFIGLAILLSTANAATLQNLETSKIQATTCSPPPVATSFTSGDSYAYAYFSIAALNMGDQVILYWNRPSTGSYSAVYAKATNPGNHCYVSYLTNSQFVPYPGTWFLAVSINGIYQPLRPTFTVAGTPTQITQTPPQLNLSTGDASKTILTTRTPAATYTPTFSSGFLGNPNSNCTVSLRFSAGTGTSTVSSGVTASPAGCSGVFNVSSASAGISSSSSTKVVVPPQILVQMLYGEAHAQAIRGDNVSQLAIGVATRNRFAQSGLFSGVTTYQAAITSAQFAGISTITSGPSPDIDNAAQVFTTADGVSVANAACFFSPTASGWTLIKAALNSKTVTLPSVSFDPKCYGAGRQFVVKQSVGINVNGSGAPAFIFEQRRNATDPAVIQIP